VPELSALEMSIAHVIKHYTNAVFTLLYILHKLGSSFSSSALSINPFALRFLPICVPLLYEVCRHGATESVFNSAIIYYVRSPVCGHVVAVHVATLTALDSATSRRPVRPRGLRTHLYSRIRIRSISALLPCGGEHRSRIRILRFFHF